MSVSVVIPNWNGERRLPGLFECLRHQEDVGECLMVDNGSADRSVDVAAAAGARVIEMGRNAGFAAAVNRGVREARGGWVAILNNDVVLEPHWVRTLLVRAEARQAWFATGKLLDSRRHDILDGTYDALCRGGTAWRCGAGRLDGSAFQSETQIRMAPFTAVLVRRSLFEQAGWLDERFESYLEDVDFGIRCSKKALFGIYVPNAVGYHEGSATLGRWHPETVRRISRNQLLLVAKHYPAGWPWRYGWPVAVAQGLWGMVAVRHGCGWSWLRGKWEGIRAFRGFRENAFGDPPAMDNEIRRLQRQIGSDLYWKLYFALT